MRLDDRLDKARRNLDAIDPSAPDLPSLQRRAARPAASAWVAIGTVSLIVVAMVAVGARLLSDSHDDVSVVANEGATADDSGPKLLLSSAEVPPTGGTLAMLLVDVPAFTVHDKPIQVVRLDADGEQPLGWLVTGLRGFSNVENGLSTTVPDITYEAYGGTIGGVSEPLFVGLPPLPDGDYELRLGMSDGLGADAMRLGHAAARFTVTAGAPSLPDVTDAQRNLTCSPALVTTDQIECNVIRLEVDDLGEPNVAVQTWDNGAWEDAWTGPVTWGEASADRRTLLVPTPPELPPGLIRIVLDSASNPSALAWRRSPPPAPSAEPSNDSTDLPSVEAGTASAPASSTVVLAGDFDGYTWDLTVTQNDDPVVIENLAGSGIACTHAIRVMGDVAPQGAKRLASGTCTELEGLHWQLTSASVGRVVYGHAPNAAMTLDLRQDSGDPLTFELNEHPNYPRVKFFVARVPDGFLPTEAVALGPDGEPLATIPMLTTSTGKETPLNDDADRDEAVLDPQASTICPSEAQGRRIGGGRLVAGFDATVADVRHLIGQHDARDSEAVVVCWYADATFSGGMGSAASTTDAYAIYIAGDLVHFGTTNSPPRRP